MNGNSWKYDSSCEVGWDSYQGSCYKYFAVSVSWQTARSSCQDKGADLAVVTSYAENNFIVKKTSYNSVWIGLTDIYREGTFRWIDDTGSSYRNFAYGQPSNYYNKDCVAINYSSGKWASLRCSSRLKYVCEKDNEDPQFYGCPEDVTVDTYQRTSYAVVTWVEPTASDNKGIKTEVQSHSPGQRFELVDGITTVYTVRYWVQDYVGNEAECLFNITVIDNERPQLECPKITSNYYSTNYGSIIYASTDDGSPNGTITWTPLVAIDNSGIPPLITSSPNKPGDVYPMRLFPPYSTIITATDASGNFEECELHFAVVDLESPVVNCPSHSNNFVAKASDSSWSVFTDRASKSARLYWSPANATDNSGTVVSVTSNHNPGDVFPASNVAHQITYTANDRDNNIGNCSFFIKVEDWESPSIECPSPIQVYTDDGSRFAFVTWNITLNDNIAIVHCMSNDSRVAPANITLNHKNITLEQNGSLSIGTNLVEYVVTDMSGNIGTCLLTVTVIDNERPSIICPRNFSNYYDHIFDFHRLVSDHGRPYATVTWSPPEVYDNSQESVTWESFPYTSGDMFPLREFPPYNVKFTASDQFGNNRSCYVYFTVIDIEPPIITCPTNITNYQDTYYGIIRTAIDPGSSTSTVTWDYPTVSDNSEGQVNVTSSYQSGESFPAKFYPPYEVEYIAEDEWGNRNSCKFYFLVTDNNPPKFRCPRSVRAKSQTGMNSSLVSWQIVVSDIELISLVEANHDAVMPSRLEPFKREVNLAASALLPIGITIIEYRFEDSSNNVAFCRFHVEISEYDSEVTSYSGTVNGNTITSTVTAASSTLFTVINRDDYDENENMKTSALASTSLLSSQMSTSLPSPTLLSSSKSSSSLLLSQLPSSLSSSSTTTSTSSSLSLSSSPSSSSPLFSLSPFFPSHHHQQHPHTHPYPSRRRLYHHHHHHHQQ
ncbi:hyalin-like [Anneissia japonica]|uniref:hyalin-like n=1 Tax=Anneissia japonica TaxID=1529436 RepID=UPI00142560B2|nr:hyalin-like [Anneissia japonica]